MAFLPGIFSPKPQQQQPQNMQGQGNQGQGNQGNQGQQPQNGMQPQGQQGNQQPQQQPNASQQQQPANSNVDASNPLDPFIKLMTPSADVVKDKQTRQQRDSAGLFGENFTPENIQKSVGGVNFTQNLDPAKVTAALGGDSAAFMEVINAAVQSGVAASVQMSHGMVEQGVKTGQDRFSGDLDSRFRDYGLRNQNADNPALKHPVGKALLSTVSKQIAEANPRMSADEVNSHATKMFGDFFKLGNTPVEDANDPKNRGGKGEMDWLSYMDDQPTQ